MNKQGVFVYGASGYTGRLISYELKKRRIPFTMGGRNLQRLNALKGELGEKDIQIVEVSHNVESLTKAFQGYEVVINVTGPYTLLGETVVKAALKAETHYLDCTGEQEFMLLVKERYDLEARQRNRVFITANSWYYALGESAALYLHENYPRLDTFKILYCPQGQPTIASLQSVIRVVTRSGYAFLSGKLEKVTKLNVVPFLVPGEVIPRPTVPLPGGEVIHFAGEEGIKNVEVFYGPEKPAIIPFLKTWRRMASIFGKSLDPLSDWLVKRFWRTPPAEDPAATRFVVLAAGESDIERKICLLLGSRPYVTTGFLCGEAAERLLSGKYKRTGVVSTPQAFGAKEILQALTNCGVSYRVYE